VFNPFPGLRPFEPDEDHLFFGREKEIDELLRRLRSTRFLSVVGTSGSGKSSLVRSGLIPSLYSGFMVTAGSSWRVAMLRPGEDPMGHLVEALDQSGVLGVDGGELATTNRVLIEATLRRGSLGLVDAVSQARIPAGDNLLVVVDQFEELFRFRRSRLIDTSRDDATSFVKLLLEATRRNDLPIYVVLTMRSDFIGDCMEYAGLPEAVNQGQYLVPRMTRDEVRLAITGPIAVGGGEIAPRLVLRLLNELGDDQDQLPVLQHALMRTWDYWERHHQAGEPIDAADYEAIGTLRQALSLHAEEAYQAAAGSRGPMIAERIFKALTDTFSDPRGIRSPTPVHELAEISEASEVEVIEVIEIFRRPGRSFLMPPSPVPLSGGSIIDLSHESLMRRWTRLVAWAEEDRLSATFYMRLSEAARWFAEGAAGLWRNPELELGLRWKRLHRPTAAWARRLDGSFDRALAFLDLSEQAHNRAEAELARERKRKLRQAQWTAVVMGLLFLAAGFLATVARQENRRATENLQLAKEAVDQTLSSAGLDPASAGADVPQMAEFRRQLLEKAKVFYVDFLKQDARNEGLRNEMAHAHLRLGHIYRWLEQTGEATREYEQAIALFEGLERQTSKVSYRHERASAYNWLGLTLTALYDRDADAETAYNNALRLQREDLAHAGPSGAADRQTLARTLYNRGMLRSKVAVPGAPEFGAAESDFREAIRLLEPLAKNPTDGLPSLEIARAYNNLASLIAADDQRLVEARALYEAAIRHDEELTRAEPANREYKLELAKYCDNLSDLLRQLDDNDLAQARSRQALDLLDLLALPALSLGIEQADAHNLRGQILQTRDVGAAVTEYQEALEIFEQLGKEPTARRSSSFHQRYDDLLLSLARFGRESRDAGIHRLLRRALTSYLVLAEEGLASGSVADAKLALDNVSRVLPEVSEADRASVLKAYQELADKMAQRR
jgi:tetratricopeptide (TPR) repeat protein/energy-coupling factor transporter ATP-binding protein EcfA2